MNRRYYKRSLHTKSLYLTTMREYTRIFYKEAICPTLVLKLNPIFQRLPLGQDMLPIPIRTMEQGHECRSRSSKSKRRYARG